MNKIILITISPFTTRDYRRFKLDHLNDRGETVEIWDLSNYMSGGTLSSTSRKQFGDLRVLNSLEELDKVSRKTNQTNLFLLIFNFVPQTLPILRVLSKYDLNLALFRANRIQGEGEKGNKPDLTAQFYSVLKKLPKITASKILKKLKYRVFNLISPELLGVSRVDYLIAGGRKSIKGLRITDENTKTIWTHTLDYERYLDFTDHDASHHDKDYVVFLDEYLPFHPDYEILDIDSPTADQYYPEVNKFFDQIEERTGYEVVIALHPKADYEVSKKWFGERTLKKNQTLKLVSESKFTLAHMSTSINFSVLMNKPVVFFSSDLVQEYFGGVIKARAQQLGCEVVNISNWNPENLETHTQIDSQKYRQYKRNYIKKPSSPDKPFWDIILGEIK